MFKRLPLELIVKILSSIDFQDSRYLLKYRSVSKQFNAAYMNIVDGNNNRNNTTPSKIAQLLELMIGKHVCDSLIENYHTDHQAVFNFFMEKCYELVNFAQIKESMDEINNLLYKRFEVWSYDELQPHVQSIRNGIFKVNSSVTNMKLFDEKKVYKHAVAILAVAYFKAYPEDKLSASTFLIFPSRLAIRALNHFDNEIFSSWFEGVPYKPSALPWGILLYDLTSDVQKNNAVIDINLSTLFDDFSCEKKTVFVKSIIGEINYDEAFIEVALSKTNLINAFTDFLSKDERIKLPMVSDLISILEKCIYEEYVDLDVDDPMRLSLAKQVIKLKNAQIRELQSNLINTERELNKRKSRQEEDLNNNSSEEDYPTKKSKIELS